jgi:putative phosphoesterase
MEPGNAMRILIVSDLHGNLEALRSLPVEYDELWVLGDLVNYGPNPCEVIDFVREHASLVVRGNHDDAIGYDRDPECSAPYRRLAEETGRFTMSVVSGEQREFLRSLPLTAERNVGGVRFFACHAAPGDPLHEYRPFDSELWVQDASKGDCDVLLTGHTHIAFCRPVDGRWVVNPGSVGQSKQVGARCYYAIWEDGRPRLESVEYDVEATAAKLKGMPVTPETRERLEIVLRTGTLPDRG